MVWNLKRGFLRLWALGSVAWVALTVVLFWDKVHRHLSIPETPPPAGFELAYEPMSPILEAFLFGISAPAASFALGLGVMWIYRGFAEPKD